MSDPVDEAYEKYLSPATQPPQSLEERESEVDCPRCESEDVDRRSGYRGEYKCNNCGHHWQVGGGQAT